MLNFAPSGPFEMWKSNLCLLYLLSFQVFLCPLANKGVGLHVVKHLYFLLPPGDIRQLFAANLFVDLLTHGKIKVNRTNA